MSLSSIKNSYLQSIDPSTYISLHNEEKKTLTKCFTSYMKIYCKHFQELSKFTLFAPIDGNWNTEKEYLKIYLLRLSFDLVSICMVSGIGLIFPFYYIFSNPEEKLSLSDTFKFLSALYLAALPLSILIGGIDISLQLASFLISPFTRTLATIAHLLHDSLMENNVPEMTI